MGTAEKEMRRVKRYMIYMPASGPDRLIHCGEGGSLTLSEMETLVDGAFEELPSHLDTTWAREPVDCIKLVVCAGERMYGGKRNERATLFYACRDREVLVGDALLCAKVDGELIGFTLPVARTICEEFGIDVDVKEDI